MDNKITPITEDCFNGRIIPQNGRITTAEAKAIAETAERFGNGEGGDDLTLAVRYANHILLPESGKAIFCGEKSACIAAGVIESLLRPPCENRRRGRIFSLR